MTCHQFADAFRPHRNDVAVLRAALAWVIALIVLPIRRAATEARLERLALAARRNAMLSRSAPSGIVPLPLAVWTFAGRIDATPPVPPYNHEPLAIIDVMPETYDPDFARSATSSATVAEFPSTVTVVWPFIDPPAAPAKPKRVRKPAAPKKAAPKKTTVKAAANKPVKAPGKPAKTRKAPKTADVPVKAPRKRKAAPKTAK